MMPDSTPVTPTGSEEHNFNSELLLLSAVTASSHKEGSSETHREDGKEAHREGGKETPVSSSRFTLYRNWP
jgi:hypothetical protein